MPDSERDRVVAEIGPSREMQCLILGDTILPEDDGKAGAPHELGVPVLYSRLNRRFWSESAVSIDYPQTAPCGASGSCGSRPTLDLPHSLRRPDLFERSRLWLRDRSLRNKDFGVSGTLGGEWQPASGQVNDSGCRQRAREC